MGAAAAGSEQLPRCGSAGPPHGCGREAAVRAAAGRGLCAQGAGSAATGGLLCFMEARGFYFQPE